MTIYWHTIHKELVIVSKYQYGVGDEINVESQHSMLSYSTQACYLIGVRGSRLFKLRVLYGF